MNDKSTGTFLSNFQNGKNNQSVFEKVDTHDGHATYLGSGTFFDLENCIHDCLSKNRCHTDLTHRSSKYDDPCKSLTRASVLEDYSYDGILEPKHHISHLSHSHYHDYDYCHNRSDHHYSDHHQRHHGDYRKHAADLSLEEIRQVNDSLAKYGIPVFSHHENPHNPHHKPHSVGEIVSACRLLLNEPRLEGLHHNGHQAVQHVWDAIHNHPMPPPHHGYASPAVQGVASHLFHPNQTPYDPVHGVASHLFGPPHQAPYNPGPSGVSHFVAPSQPPPYNPGPPPPMQNQLGPPQSGPQNSGQSVLSRLFGSR
ncbi:hypothetical protein I4U23_029628 [Adineta vaga]|nr:hypothetical protein I4U23_029628 [Adineta vaga]